MYEPAEPGYDDGLNSGTGQLAPPNFNDALFVIERKTVR